MRKVIAGAASDRQIGVSGKKSGFNTVFFFDMVAGFFFNRHQIFR